MIFLLIAAKSPLEGMAERRRTFREISRPEFHFRQPVEVLGALEFFPLLAVRPLILQLTRLAAVVVLLSRKHPSNQIKSMPFEPKTHNFPLLHTHDPAPGEKFYGLRTRPCVTRETDYHRLNIHLSQDNDFVTIWWGVRESALGNLTFDSKVGHSNQ